METNPAIKKKKHFSLLELLALIRVKKNSAHELAVLLMLFLSGGMSLSSIGLMLRMLDVSARRLLARMRQKGLIIARWNGKKKEYRASDRGLLVLAEHFKQLSKIGDELESMEKRW